MQNKFSMEELYPIIQEVLESGGEFKLIPQGTSMLPLLQGGRDSVLLVKKKARLNKYDMALYRRANKGFVLHRVVGEQKARYIFCGDNQFEKEYGIRDNQVIAVVKGYYKKGKYIDCKDWRYRLYTRVWCNSRGVRKIFIGLKSVLGKILRFSKNK